MYFRVILVNNKNAFQSEAHLPLANRKSNTYNLTLEWPCPQTSQTKLNWWPGSKMSIFHEMTLTLTQWLYTQTWPRYGQDVTPYQKWSFYVNSFKSYSPNRQTHTQIHRHTDTTKTLPLPHTREVKTTKLRLIKRLELSMQFSTNVFIVDVTNRKGMWVKLPEYRPKWNPQ